MKRFPRIVTVIALMAIPIAGAVPQAIAGQSTLLPLEDAHRMFYSGRYDAAAALALSVRESDAGNLGAFELRASALHFQIKRAVGNAKDKDLAWKECAECRDWLSAFMAETNLGRTAARARLMEHPADDDALFYLGKLNLNYVWLQLATLGKKSGWSEYWEARKSLDAVLKKNPDHVRARVARAWIDYIVDTKVPFGTRWLLGGGDKKKGLQVALDATRADAPPYVQAEAMFALWDMQVRERNLTDAVVTARALSRDFPDNRDLVKFIAEHDLRTSR